ncbi:hypothetical protein N1851_034188 [Merluccius polli]|uniref:Uncharacterized protein n=1 Tax=Merluccius polli TaxID=89951 RepID=A0AA47M003_MERPO|nr:hypothetical protein N1851_034188 [Merluccius polli]
MKGFDKVLWNFTEASHGKGAPDGVGGALKTLADRMVAHETDLPNVEVLMQNLSQQSSVKLLAVTEDKIAAKGELVPLSLRTVPGTMKVHLVKNIELPLCMKVRSSVIREELGVDPLLLRVERSQMRWLGHLVRMPPGRLPGEVFRARPTGRRPRGRPRTRWRDYVSRLAWERLGIPQEELAEVAGEREVWASLLRLLPPRPDPG